MRTIQPLANGLLVLALSAGLPAPVRATTEAPTPASLTTALEAEACRMALVFSGGDDVPSRSIARWQAQVRSHDDGKVFAYLERLGWAYVAKARATLDPGFYSLAAKTADCMDQVEADRPASLLLRGHVLHNQHRFVEAAAVARRLVAQRGLAYDYGLLGDASLEQGDLAGARQAYERMMALRPSPEAYARAAELRWLHGDLDGAIQAMELAWRSARSAPEAIAWYTVQLARYVWQGGDSARAQTLALDALAMRPGYPSALLLQGRLLLGAGRPQAALDPLRRAVAAQPLPEHRWVLAECLRLLGHSAEALEMERELIARGTQEDPRTVSLYLSTSQTDPGMALTLARREIAKRRDARTLDAMAWALYVAGETRPARRHLDEALATGIVDPRLYLHAAAMAESAAETRDWINRIGAQATLLLPRERTLLAKLGEAVGVAFTTAPSAAVPVIAARHHPR